MLSRVCSQGCVGERCGHALVNVLVLEHHRSASTGVGYVLRRFALSQGKPCSLCMRLWPGDVLSAPRVSSQEAEVYLHWIP